MAVIGRRHEAARGCPKANHTGTSRRENENFVIWAGSPTYPSPEGIRASPLLGAGYKMHEVVRKRLGKLQGPESTEKRDPLDAIRLASSSRCIPVGADSTALACAIN